MSRRLWRFICSTLAFFLSLLWLESGSCPTLVSLLSLLCQSVDHHHHRSGRHHLRRGEVPSQGVVSRRLPDQAASGVLPPVSASTEAPGELASFGFTRKSDVYSRTCFCAAFFCFPGPFVSGHFPPSPIAAAVVLDCRNASNASGQTVCFYRST